MGQVPGAQSLHTSEMTDSCLNATLSGIEETREEVLSSHM